MLCVIAGGDWNNGSNAGLCALNLNNVRGNSNNNVGFRADSSPSKRPHAANAVRQRGSDRRGWCRNQTAASPSVADPRPGAGHAKTGLQPFGSAP